MSMIPRTIRFDRYSFDPNKVLEEDKSSIASAQPLSSRIETHLKKTPSDRQFDQPLKAPDQFAPTPSALKPWSAAQLKVGRRGLFGEPKMLHHPLKILVGFHNAPSSRKALGAALAIARKYSSPLVIAEVLPPEFEDTDAMMQRETALSEQLTPLFERYFSPEQLKKYPPQLRVVTHFYPADALIQLARQDNCALIALGESQGEKTRRGPELFGVLQQKSPYPLLVWPASRDSVQIRHILQMSDGSRASYAAMGQSMAIAKELGGELLVFKMGEATEESKGEQSGWRELKEEQLELKGDMQDTLREFIGSGQVDLMVGTFPNCLSGIQPYEVAKSLGLPYLSLPLSPG